MSDALLRVDNIHTYLGDSHIIQGVSLDVPAGKVVALLGRNGAGKTTTLRSIMRMVPPRRGTVTFEGRDISRLATYEIARARIAFVQETRAIFPSLSVEENLAIAARPIAEGSWSIERIYNDFPSLAARRRNSGTQLSGGEQQMLAIARALMGRPTLLLLDEPSLGLAPLIVKQIFAAIRSLNADYGLTVFLVEQSAYHALRLADRGYVMVNGKITMSGTGAELLGSPEVQSAYLEGGAHSAPRVGVRK